MNWLQSLLYGAVSGFAEFLPISAEAHRRLLHILMGSSNHALLELTIHLSALLALLLSCWPQLSKLQRERRIAAVPARRRKRQPDPSSLNDLRFLKTAVMLFVVIYLLLSLTKVGEKDLWVMAAVLAVNGILLYLPPYLPGGNKSSMLVSRLDGLLAGLGAAFSAICGISLLTGITVVGQLRRCDRSYILEMGLLLSIPALVLLSVLDLVALFVSGVAVTGGLLLSCLLAALTAFPAAYLGVTFIRFLAVKVGFSGFSYYSWGAALFTFIIYLTI